MQNSQLHLEFILQKEKIYIVQCGQVVIIGIGAHLAETDGQIDRETDTHAHTYTVVISVA